MIGKELFPHTYAAFCWQKAEAKTDAAAVTQRASCL